MFGHIPLTKNIHSSKCILWDSEKLQNLLKENGQHTAAYIAGKKWYFNLEFADLIHCSKIKCQLEHVRIIVRKVTGYFCRIFSFGFFFKTVCSLISLEL